MDLFRRHLDESCEATEPFNYENKSIGFYAGWNLIGNECEMADGNEKFPFKILSSTNNHITIHQVRSLDGRAEAAAQKKSRGRN